MFDEVTQFYRSTIGMEGWLGQDGIDILRHDNMLIGFHRSQTADLDGLLTFYYRERREVDRFYELLSASASGPPKENPTYGIYHFFSKDPEGRKIEFQTFLHELPDGPQSW